MMKGRPTLFYKRFEFSPRLLAVVGLVCLLVVPPVLNSAVAQLGCVNGGHYADDILIDYSYSICNVPDIDQRRSAAEPFLIGLPNNGSMYCVPTAVINWMAYIANHGYPNVSPGSGDWQLGPPDHFDVYNKMTDALLALGMAMGTDPNNGTGGAGGEAGLHAELDIPYPGAFSILHQYADGNSSPVFNDLVQLAVGGCLVMPVVGWYTNADQNLPHVRSGGHCFSMVAANRFGGGPATIGIHDPAAPNDKQTTSQSTFTTDTYGIGDVMGIFDGFPRTQSRMVSFGSGYIDEFFAIAPNYGLTADENHLIVLSPVRFLGLDKPVRQIFSSATGGKILDLVLDPVRTRHPYLIEGSHSIWELNIVTGRSRALTTLRDDLLGLVLCGPERNLYVNTPNALVCLTRDGVERKRVALRSRLDAIACDENRRRLVGISMTDHQLFVYDLNLNMIGSAPLPDIPCGPRERPLGHVAVSINWGDGSVLLHCDGSNKVTRLRLDDRGRLDATELTLDSVRSPLGLHVDEHGHLFVTDDGVIAEFDQNGRRLSRSPFNGLPAGNMLRLLHSFSNFDPKTKSGPAYYNVLPENAVR